MEPRQLWDRNAVLAEAFCLSDEQVRAAQGSLDEAQAGRARMLAALAVTVGNDGAVANLLGLHEREVRVARRTVGRHDARTVADDLLSSTTAVHQHPSGQQPPPQRQTGEPLSAETAPRPHAVADSAGQASPADPAPWATGPADETAAISSSPPPVSGSPVSVPVTGEPEWTPAMDAVLVGGWCSGIDLQLLAEEFGVDLIRLVARAQHLSTQGRLTPVRPHDAAEDQAGRHRRGAAHHRSASAIPAQQTYSPVGTPAAAWTTDAGTSRDVPMGWNTGGHRDAPRGWDTGTSHEAPYGWDTGATRDVPLGWDTVGHREAPIGWDAGLPTPPGHRLDGLWTTGWDGAALPVPDQMWGQTPYQQPWPQYT